MSSIALAGADVHKDLNQLLETFVNGTTQQQLSALSGMIKAHVLHRATKEPAFETGLAKLADLVASTGKGIERLQALAAFGQIASVVKVSRTRLSVRLKGALVDPLPPLQSLPDPDQRFYAASCWRFAPASWWGDYLAAGAACEESAERARAECIEGLLELSGDVRAALEQLRRQIGKLRFETQAPGDSMARRMRRIFSALRNSPALDKTEPSVEVGGSLARLLRDAFHSTAFPSDPAPRMELAEETTALIHQFLRLRFSLSTIVETYAALDIVRGSFRASEWSNFAEGSAAAKSVASDIAEALRLLVRAGMTDDGLIEKLSTATGSAESARLVLRTIADEFPGLAPGVRSWLLGIRPPKESALARESQYRALDEVVADLLIEARKLSQTKDAVCNEVVPEVSVVTPRLADILRTFMAACDDLLNHARLAAERRGLQVFGRTGEEIEFSPLEHEMIGGWQPGVRRVRIIRPTVRSQSPGGTPRVVRKALVEPIRNEP